MNRLADIFDGWNGYQTSLLHAITPLTPEQLKWRPAPERRSLGELVRHLSLGRITWFSRMRAPGIEEVEARVPSGHADEDGERHVEESAVPCDDAAVLCDWLAWSWEPIRRMLDEWTTGDLAQTYPHHFRDTEYSISRQWTIWRILTHDVHHGGQIALMLGMQGIDAFELRALGGHITVPPPATPHK